MSHTSVTQPTLAAVLWPESVALRVLRWAVLAIAGSLLMTLSAKVNIPFYPVPLTMQTLVALLIGAAFGWRLGFATIVLYLAEGAAGLPVFAGTPAKGIGLAYMMGPTGGYLIGFALAAALVGWLAERGWDRSVVTTFAAMVLGIVAIYLPGVTWLSSLIGLDKALTFGLYPFVYGDLLKIALGTAILPFAWKLVRRP